MELARDRNCTQARYSNRRFARIAGARRKGRRALAWNGRVPSRGARDAGFFERTANCGARIADAACCGALQQACANRAGWWLVSYDLLRANEADNPVCPTMLADTIVCVTAPRASFHSATRGFSMQRCRQVFRRAKRRVRFGALLSRLVFLVCRRRTKLPLAASALPSWPANAFSKL